MMWMGWLRKLATEFTRVPTQPAPSSFSPKNPAFPARTSSDAPTLVGFALQFDRMCEDRGGRSNSRLSRLIKFEREGGKHQRKGFWQSGRGESWLGQACLGQGLVNRAAGPCAWSCAARCRGPTTEGRTRAHPSPVGAETVRAAWPLGEACPCRSPIASLATASAVHRLIQRRLSEATTPEQLREQARDASNANSKRCSVASLV